jgi:hypothetical protein
VRIDEQKYNTSDGQERWNWITGLIFDNREPSLECFNSGGSGVKKVFAEMWCGYER